WVRLVMRCDGVRRRCPSSVASSAGPPRCGARSGRPCPPTHVCMPMPPTGICLIAGCRHAPYYAHSSTGDCDRCRSRAIFMTAAGATSSAVRNDYIPEGDLRVRLHAGGRSLELARHLLLPPRAQHREELILTVERL